MRVPTLIALSAASVSALPATDKLFKRQAAPNAPDAFGLAYTTPPVAANGGAWSAAFARAGAVTAQMTLEEKVSIFLKRGGGSLLNSEADIQIYNCRSPSLPVRTVDVSVTPAPSPDSTSLKSACKMGELEIPFD